jgi:hypothetical protein
VRIGGAQGHEPADLGDRVGLCRIQGVGDVGMQRGRQNGKAYVEDQFDHRTDAYVVTPRIGAKYLRIKKDGVWTNNLLALPRR